MTSEGVPAGIAPSWPRPPTLALKGQRRAVGPRWGRGADVFLFSSCFPFYFHAFSPFVFSRFPSRFHLFTSRIFAHFPLAFFT